MKTRKLSLPTFLLLALASAARAQTAGPLRFRVRLAPDAAGHAVSGRLFVFMTDSKNAQTDLSSGFGGLSSPHTLMVAQEVANLAPGGTVTVDPDATAYPQPLSTAAKGDWQVMALLDTDHSYAYSEEGPGDIKSAVVKEPALDPANAGTVDVTLAQTVPSGTPKDTANVKAVTFQSRVLTAFWGRPIEMRAYVVLPPDAGQDPNRRYATVYHVHGYGGNGTDAWRAAAGNAFRPGLLEQMRSGKIPAMVHVFLDGSGPLGHHEFADSVNNGPWGRALTTELIPYLERVFPMDPRPAARFLTGHSSGGWSTLWLQVTYPEAFGGTWSTSPDPVDFRSFTGVDITAPNANAYRKADGTPRNLVRMGGKDVMTMEQFTRYELVTGAYGGQQASFDAVFSPRSADGRPMPMFDRQTGAVDPAVAAAWQKYDIRRTLAENWPRLGPALSGKIHIVVGDADNFHLEEAVVLLRDFLNSNGSDATVQILPGRDHMNLYMGGLDTQIYIAMGAAYAKATGKAAGVLQSGKAADHGHTP